MQFQPKFDTIKETWEYLDTQGILLMVLCDYNQSESICIASNYAHGCSLRQFGASLKVDDLKQ